MKTRSDVSSSIMLKSNISIVLLLVSILIASPVFGGQPPYPIVFVHGINSDHSTWDSVETSLTYYYQWDYQIVHVTLDHTVNYSSPRDSKEDDVYLFTQVIDRDFYLINFDIDHEGKRRGGNNNNILDLQDYVNDTETSFEVDFLDVSGTTYDEMDDIDSVIVAGDIVRIEDEYMEVDSVVVQPSGNQADIYVQRGLYGTTPVSHGITEEVFVVSNESNQASIEKQAYALSLAVSDIKQVTGSDKVILAGHSMGGLAVRCYAQHYVQNDVAKIITIGTPQLGAVKEDLYWDELVGFFISIDIKSEAARDLAYWYDQETTNVPAIPGIQDLSDIGVFLFGGNENSIPSGDYINRDVNSNGNEGDNIVGLNKEQLPNYFETYFLIAKAQESTRSRVTVDNDGVVLLPRQWLKLDDSSYLPGNFVWDTSSTLSAWHTRSLAEAWLGGPDAWETGEFTEIIVALDEPDSVAYAYYLDLDTEYDFLTTYQTGPIAEDNDWFTFETSAQGTCIVSFSNLQNWSNALIAIYDDNEQLVHPLVFPSGPEEDVGFLTPSGTNIFKVNYSGFATSTSWQSPNHITITHVPSGETSIVLTIPNGGESWEVGTTETIHWLSIGISGTVSIKLNRQYPIGGWQLLASGIDVTDDQWEWFPVTDPLSEECRIAVTSETETGVGDTSATDFTINATPPDPVDDLTIMADIGSDDVTLHWNAVSSASSYDVYAGPTSDFAINAGNRIGNTRDTFFTHEDVLLSDTMKFYALKASVTASPGLIAYYPFDGNANDTSGNGFHGELFGSADCSDGVLTLGNNALDCVSLPYEVVNGIGDFTICALLRVSMNPTSQSHCWFSGARSSSEANEFTMWYSTPYWNITIGNGYQYLLNSGTQSPEDLEWHHTTITRQGSEVRLYVDGYEVDNVTTSTYQPIIAEGGFIIGQEQDNVGGGFESHQNFDGQMDEIRFYNRALSLEEIQNLVEP